MSSAQLICVDDKLAKLGANVHDGTQLGLWPQQAPENINVNLID